MNIYRNFKDHVVQAAMQSTGFDQIADHHKFIRSITVEPPRDAANGDLATNVAMVLARPLAKKPREIAAFIVEQLCKLPDVASAEIAGAGFINIRLGDDVWLQTIEDILCQGHDFARPKLDARRKINVEYVSANPTGPLHLGHCRGAVVGDCLANLLSFAGHDVTREYYVNDAGAQIDILVRSCLLRYRQARGENIGAIPEGMYPGEYLIPVGKALFEHYSDKLIPMETQEACALIRPFCLSAMLDMIRNDLARLGIAHDVFFHEQTLHKKGGEIDIVLKQLAEEGLTYHGQLPPPKGKDDGDWEPREQLLFYASRFGDDTDRALRKTDGSATYFLAEIAYLRSKFKRGFRDMLFVLGADHGGYLKRLEAAGKAISAGKARINVNVCQMVKLLRKGAPVKMSKRAGEFVSLSALLDEVGRDAVRYMMVSRKNDSPVNFDFDIMKEKSKENPVFYIQYAFTRCRSVFRQAVTADVDVSGIISSCHKVLNQQPEMTFKASEYVIIRKLADFPRQIELAVDHEEPHRIALYLYELAALFHAHWNLGKESPQLRFINPFNKHLTEKRLILVKAIETVLGEGLRLLGVTAPEEMR